MVRPIITICSSANFYRQAVDIQAKLNKEGFSVMVPATAERMKKSGDFEVSHYKTWLSDAKDYHKKAALMHGHFDRITEADAILVINNEKHGIKNYIGGNVLMEMGLAFHLNKPIFILNEIPKDSPLIEEILGLNPIVLHGKSEALKDEYNKLQTK
jgi:hypothetical protein